MRPLDPLPIDDAIPAIVATLRQSRALVLSAEPGAGKTTRVPPALTPAGPVILLQPRRVAARAIARRIADERGWTLGREVGWHIRFEPRFTRDTQLIVATEGMLTARLLEDPLLSGFRTIVLDEFHERSVHADLGLALARQAWLARDDLQLLVMSATIDAAAVARFLGDCPTLAVPGRGHALDISYAGGSQIADAIRAEVHPQGGTVLCFLPGAPEIRRTATALSQLGPGVPVVPLHGSLDADEQDEALRPHDGPRIVLATNLAETTLTVPGVRTVVDSGLQKVARYDADRAIDSLETERVSQASADQRAGRAGRLGPGRAIRLWSALDRLRPHREPEIARIDVAAVLLDVIAWGGRPDTFEWFEAPPAAAVAAALLMLERLGALEGGAMTPLGRVLQRLPLHPRLGRILVAAGGAPEAALACAALSERHATTGAPAATSCDLLLDRREVSARSPHVLRVAEHLSTLVRPLLGTALRGRADELVLRRALFAGYPDRLARRRSARGPAVVLASGVGATMARESGVVEGEFLIALDVQATGGEVLVRLASRVDDDWIVPTGERVVHRFDDGVVRASRQRLCDALVLSDHPVAPDPDEAARLLAEAFRARGPAGPDLQLLRRVAFAGVALDQDALIQLATAGRTRLEDVRLAQHVPSSVTRELATLAPASIIVPSGRTLALEYGGDGTVSLAVKLQELFGLRETPRVGPRRDPIVLHLLSPAGRPVQTTRDLASFWKNGYPEVRKELRGRYPKHPWPENPLTATPTARAKARR